MPTLTTDYGTWTLPDAWDGANGFDFRETDTVDGVEVIRFYAPAYALMLQAQDRATSFGGAGFSMRFSWDTGTSDADPGAGKVRLNHATAGSATAIYVDDQDAGGSDRTGLFALFDDRTSTVKGHVSLIKLTDPNAWVVGEVTATEDASGYYKLTIRNTQASSASPFTAADTVVMGFIAAGDRGWPTNGFRWTFSTTTTDADPGAGVLRLNNATQNAATQAFIDLLDADGATQTTWLDGLDDASGARKGKLKIAAQTDPTRYLLCNLTSVTSASGYRKLVFTVVSSSGANPFTDAESLFVSFAEAGDAGDVTGPASSTDNALALWNGAGGNQVKNSPHTVDTTTGVMTLGGSGPGLATSSGVNLDIAPGGTGQTTVKNPSFSGGDQWKVGALGTATTTQTVGPTTEPIATVTLGADVNLDHAAPTSGYRYWKDWEITQDGTGARVPSFRASDGTAATWPLDDQPTWSAQAAATRTRVAAYVVNSSTVEMYVRV